MDNQLNLRTVVNTQVYIEQPVTVRHDFAQIIKPMTDDQLADMTVIIDEELTRRNREKEELD